MLPPATHQALYNPSFDGVQAVFVYNPATNVTTLSYYDGSSTPVFQLKFTGNVHYDRDAFLGISPSHSPTEGDDDVFGTPNADNINLLGGDDLFIGNEGNDFVSGGSGNDHLEGDEGNDDLRGGSGNDFIAGGAGDDFISGHTGDDTLQGSRGNDTLNGNRGYDTVDAIDTFGDFIITKNADGSIALTDINASDEVDWGTDTFINVEAIRFADGVYVIATNTFTPFDSVI